MNGTYKILGVPFRTELVPLADDAGESHAAHRYIKVDSDSAPDARVETFYHEVVHMMLELLGYDKLIGEQHEEAISQGLGLAIYQLIRDNPNLPGREEE